MGITCERWRLAGGTSKRLPVPMLECGCCGHDVVCHFTILEKYQRFWLDLDQDVVFGSGLCESLRQSRVSAGVQWWVAVWGCAPAHRRINQIAPLLKHAHQDPISDVPPVVQFDGIWLRLQIPTDTYKRDKRQRKRQGRKGKKVVLLVATSASGPMAPGRLWTLKWPTARAKRGGNDSCTGCGNGVCGWRRACKRWEADGSGELGEALALVYGATIVEQRCIFHKLRNVADKCREELKGDDHKEMRTQVLEQARSIYQAESARGPPEHAWRPLPTPGAHARPRRWPPSNGISSRRL